MVNLDDRTSRPWSCPHQMDPIIESRVLTLRDEHPVWGPDRIRYELEQENIDGVGVGVGVVPSRSAIYRALVRGERIDPAKRKRRRADYRRWERGRPMELWQMDIVGGVHLSDGVEVKCVSGIDDNSRYVVSAKLVTRATARPVCEALVEALARHGLPEQILTDNGKVFTGRFGPHGSSSEVLFDRVCAENGIRYLLTAPRSPTTTGKVERLHKTMRAECFNLEDRRYATIGELQAAVDAWVVEYNTRRPHQSLGMRPPAERFDLVQAPEPVTTIVPAPGIDQTPERAAVHGHLPAGMLPVRSVSRFVGKAGAKKLKGRTPARTMSMPSSGSRVGESSTVNAVTTPRVIDGTRHAGLLMSIIVLGFTSASMGTVAQNGVAARNQLDGWLDGLADVARSSWGANPVGPALKEAAHVHPRSAWTHGRVVRLWRTRRRGHHGPRGCHGAVQHIRQSLRAQWRRAHGRGGCARRIHGRPVGGARPWGDRLGRVGRGAGLALAVATVLGAVPYTFIESSLDPGLTPAAANARLDAIYDGDVWVGILTSVAMPIVVLSVLTLAVVVLRRQLLPIWAPVSNLLSIPVAIAVTVVSESTGVALPHPPVWIFLGLAMYGAAIGVSVRELKATRTAPPRSRRTASTPRSSS